MGVKFEIDRQSLPIDYRGYSLIPTSDGVVSTLYLLDDRYALKIYDDETPQQSIDEEISLLSHIATLKVPQIVDTFRVDGKRAILYTQISGESPQEPTLGQISQIGRFLSDLHITTQGMNSSNPDIFGRAHLEKLISTLHHPTLYHHYSTIECHLRADGIIHGDLFRDNAKFEGDRLSGVFDFSDTCVGDFRFDLAVVALDWCFDGEKLNSTKIDTLLESYHHQTITTEELLPYLRYALLRYATSREVGGYKDSGVLLRRLEGLS